MSHGRPRASSSTSKPRISKQEKPGRRSSTQQQRSQAHSFQMTSKRWARGERNCRENSREEKGACRTKTLGAGKKSPESTSVYNLGRLL
eukprot:6175111-Pleurochrysis_carterae.AAC.1